MLPLVNTSGAHEGSLTFYTARAGNQFSEKMVFGKDGLDLSTGNLQVSGTKVVGVQQAAVADTTDVTYVAVQLNDLLAKLRTPGFIA